MKETAFIKKQEPATLIYDGSCPLCSGAVGWIRENEIENSLIMLPCQMAETASRFPEIERADCMNAMHLVLPNGTVLVGERAMPEVFARLKHYRFVALLFKIPGSLTISRIAYRWFADRRYKLATILSHFTGRTKKQIK
jgi:predicted DCC family thiol-disulfide oxidoreductase YuxK